MYLALLGLVVVEVIGLRRFSSGWGRDHELCHGDLPWRGEYVANFGHAPDDVRLPRAPVVAPARPFGARLRPLVPTLRPRPGSLRPAAG